MTRKGEAWAALTPSPQAPANRLRTSRAAARWCMAGSIGRGRRRATGLRRLRVDQIEGRAQPTRELRRIVVRPEVHVEEAGLVVERVAVDSRDLDAVLTKRRRDRIDL